MINVAVFASGSGSNAENLIRYFKDSPDIRVAAVFCNASKAFVLERIKPYGTPGILISKDDFENGSTLKQLQEFDIQFIVLAGFLKLIPENFIRSFPGKIVNLHPSLLPKYGGKGMYGMKVHEAVIGAGESKSGITIHYVDEHYDRGAIIRQFETRIVPGDTPETLAQKIHRLEMDHFPETIASIILNR